MLLCYRTKCRLTKQIAQQTDDILLNGTHCKSYDNICVLWLQVASLENTLSQAQGRLAEHSSGSELRAARAEQDRWRWQSEAEELRTLLASRDREIGKMQSKQEVSLNQLDASTMAAMNKSMADHRI